MTGRSYFARGVLALASVVLSGLAVVAAETSNADHASPRYLVDLGSSEADGVFPRTVTHMFGETVVAAEPQRVVVISTGQLDTVITLGVIPVGATAGDGAALYPPYLAEAFPEQVEAMNGVTNLGDRGAPNIELIAELRPDLIFMNQAVLKEEFFETLSNVAPVIVTRGNGVNWKVDFLLMAQALGKGEAAKAMLDQFHADAEAFAVGLPDEAPTVSLLQSNGARTRIMGVTSLGGGILEDLGLRRPESQQFAENSEDISVELLDLADADWLFYAGAGDGLSTLTDASLWPSLTAVNEDRAVPVDFDAFYLNAGPTAARVVLDTVVDTIQ